MEESIQAYARLRLEQAREELQAASENMERSRFRVAVSRSYYAVFYMASAALFSQSIQRAKHAGLEAAFSQFLVKPGHLEPEYSRIYQRARRQREEADYAEQPRIDRTTVAETLADAERFVDRLERFLREIDVL